MILVPILQTLIFVAYVWWVVMHYGTLPSISASWYAEGPTGKKWMFILFITLISALTLVLAWKSLWFIGSGLSLLIIAFAPAFNSENKIVGILHTGGTVGGIAFACYALATHGIYFSVILCTVGSILPERLKIDNTTWWTEIVCFSAIELGVFQLITLGL